MRKIIPLIITVFSLSAAAIAGYLYFYYIPTTIEKQVTQNLAHLGFKDLQYASKRHGGGKLVFQDITLDHDSFSKIESITVRYSLWAYLTKGLRAQSMTIKNMRLTGEMNAQEELSISGWDHEKSIVAIFALIPVENILFDGGTVDLLSERFGGLNFKFDLQVLNSAPRPAQIRGRISSQQKRLGFDARVDGSLSAQGLIDLRADIERIQIETDDYEIKRFNAKMALKKEPATSGNLSLEGVAGSVHWHGMPLGDVTINYESSGENFNVFADGHTIGDQNIEFSAQFNHVNGVTHYETSMTPPSVDDLLAYLQANKIVAPIRSLPSYIRQIKQPVLTIATNIAADQDDFDGSLKMISDAPSFEIVGDFSFNAEKKLVSGSFEMPETTTTIDFAHPKNPNKDAQSTSSGQTDQAAIDISAKGRFAIGNWGEENSLPAWEYEIIPRKDEMSYGQLKLRNISGKLSHSSAEGQTRSDTNLRYSLPLRRSIPHRGTISLNLDDPAAPFIKQILLEIYGGTIRSNALSFYNSTLPQNIDLNIGSISLSALLKDTRIGGLNMVGRMGGKLPLTLKDNKIIVKGGILQSEGAGIARVSKYVSTGMFPGYTQDMQRIRDALENYHYEFFEMRLDGDFTTSIMMTLTARGFNPDLADRTPVDLNLQIETPFSTLFNNIMAD